MGKKYIIELLDECNSKFKGIMALGLTQEQQISVELIPEESLTPYTEPDLDAIKQEEYEKGYKTAKVQCDIQTEKDLREVGERHYQKGLSDAWEAARKICTNWVLPDSVLSKIFGMDKTIDDIMKESTASEAIEKIRQYEQEKDRQARIEYNFDEIKDVLETTAKECNVSLDEIAEVFAKMKESDNG